MVLRFGQHRDQHYNIWTVPIIAPTRQNLLQLMCGHGENDGVADRLNHAGWHLKYPSVKHTARRTELVGDFVA